jgi:hypothetical protein
MSDVYKEIAFYNINYYSKNSSLEAIIWCRDTNRKETAQIKFYKSETSIPANTFANSLVTLNYPISRFNDISSIMATYIGSLGLGFNQTTSVGYLITDTSWAATAPNY